MVKTVCDLDDALLRAWLDVDLLASPAQGNHIALFIFILLHFLLLASVLDSDQVSQDRRTGNVLKCCPRFACI